MSASPALPALSTLAPVCLRELDRRAALLTRRDRKYIVALATAEAVVAELAAQARVLVIDGARSFRYSSVYFDTPELASYLGAARRRPRRFKVRTRSYVDTGGCSMEVKTRDARGLTVKHRQAHAGDDAALDAADVAFIGGFELLAGEARRLQPVLVTSYRRSTLLLGGSDSRVTIDTHVSFETVDGLPAMGGFARRSLDGYALIETKSSGRLTAADRLLWSRGIRPVSVSKYGTGLAALRPELPANRWHPVLHRYLPRHDSTAVPAAVERPPSRLPACVRTTVS